MQKLCYQSFALLFIPCTFDLACFLKNILCTGNDASPFSTRPLFPCSPEYICVPSSQSTSVLHDTPCEESCAVPYVRGLQQAASRHLPYYRHSFDQVNPDYHRNRSKHPRSDLHLQLLLVIPGSRGLRWPSHPCCSKSS